MAHVVLLLQLMVLLLLLPSISEAFLLNDMISVSLQLWAHRPHHHHLTASPCSTNDSSPPRIDATLRGYDKRLHVRCYGTLDSEDRFSKPWWNLEKEVPPQQQPAAQQGGKNVDHNRRRGVPNPNLNAQILSIAVPALISLAIDPLMTLVDTALLGRWNPEGLTALGLNTYVFTFGFYIFNFMATVPTPLVASALARDDEQAATRIIGSLLTFALVLGTVLLGVLELCGGSILTVMGATPESLPSAMSYMAIRALAAPAVLVISVGNGAFRGYLDTKTPLLIAVLVNVLNFVLDNLFILQMDLETDGAAISTVVAEWAAACIFLLLLSKKKIFPTIHPLPWEELKPIVSASGAVFGRTICLQSFLSTASAFAARTGEHSVAAHQVASQMWLFLSFSYDSLAVAAQGLVATKLAEPSATYADDVTPTWQGNGENIEIVIESKARVGAGVGGAVRGGGGGDDGGVSNPGGGLPRVHTKEARRVANRVLVFAIGSGAVLFALFSLFGGQLPLLFTPDAEIIAEVTPLIAVVGCMQPINAFVFSADGILQGSQDFAYEFKGMLMSSLLAGVWIWTQGGRSLEGVWFGLLLLLLFRGAAFSFRYWLDPSGPLAKDRPFAIQPLMLKDKEEHGSLENNFMTQSDHHDGDDDDYDNDDGGGSDGGTADEDDCKDDLISCHDDDGSGGGSGGGGGGDGGGRGGGDQRDVG